MQFFDALPESPLPGAFALTVGTFDGVHRGHQTLIARLREEAQRRGLQTAVLTFIDMPFCYFKPDECPRLLTLAEEKRAAFAPLGLDRLLIVPFTRTIAEQSADHFVSDVLVRRLGMKLLVAGPDFALGKGRAGDIPTLRTLGEQHGYEVVVLDEKMKENGVPISSTRTREAVERGDVAAARRLLGHPYSFAGGVIGGRKLGRTIGVPTINLQVHERKVLPHLGIYAARAYFDDETAAHPAALSIGTNPTVDGTGLQVEFHVIGENIPLPPREARVDVIEWLREERKFESLEALVAQMRQDINQSQSILDRLPF